MAARQRAHQITARSARRYLPETSDAYRRHFDIEIDHPPADDGL